LHYVGANGVEGWRQRAPPNAVEIAGILLRAGAVVDAMAAMYGGSTTLGLVATSIHPLQAGVQNALMAFLLDHGAAMDHPRAAGNGQSIVNGCLANGRPGAAEFLAQRGARLDLEGAAGVGRLEEVRRFFDPEGRLRSGATPDPLKSGLQWACEYGRTEVVRFLLERGAVPDEIHRGQTALHWAAYGGFAELVTLILQRKPRPRVNVQDERWRNTPLGWALHGWAHPPEHSTGVDHYEVVAALIAAGGTVDPAHVPASRVASDPRMAAMLARRSEAKVAGAGGGA
ncbi:MAG: ankyrin repeat domain-containing protein, partial [Verrucomicrobia bacterium]|nr:ankyrin repeat domain-containing protein [Verrucomicrobiota bacterium]